MKKKILMITIIMLFTTLLILSISNKVFATDLSKIEVTVPTPTIGKTLAKISEISVKADNSEKFKVSKVEWFRYNHVNKQYISVKDMSEIVGPNEKYEIAVYYNRPNKYGMTTSTKVTVNGNSINKDNIEEYNAHGGDLENEYIAVCYKFGESKVQKNLSKIEITVPTPTIGKTLAKISEISVKADNSEKFKVSKVEWFRYNHVNKQYISVKDMSEIVGPNEKYEIAVYYNRPNKYGMTTSTKVTVNGNSINKDNIEEYNAHGGDLENEYIAVCYKFGESKVQKNLSKIEITAPAPTIGKTLAKASEVTVKADGTENLKVNKIEWFRYNTVSKEYESVKNTSEIVRPNEKYKILVDYNRPQKYGVTATTKITVNGNSINKDNIEEYNAHGGDLENEYTAVCYKYEDTKTQTSTTKPTNTTTVDKGNNTQQTTKPSTTKPSTTAKPSTTTEHSNKEEIKDETVNNDKTSNETVENEVVMSDNNNAVDTNNQIDISNETIGAITTEKSEGNLIKAEYILCVISGVLGIALAFIVYKVFIYSKKEQK